ncbi:MAG TPA: hypothetical protein QF764_01770 [Planctomycetota bacterium]|nr:hypothetical protein [Planctomycetota bacterium]
MLTLSLLSAILSLSPGITHDGHGTPHAAHAPPAPSHGDARQGTAAEEEPLFLYDSADGQARAGMLASPEAYDPSIVLHEGVEWRAWLEFVPDAGDLLKVVRMKPDGSEETVTHSPADGSQRARPTLTTCPDGTLWLTFESRTANHGDWDVVARRLLEGDGGPRPLFLRTPRSNEVHHAAAGAADGSLWIAAQQSGTGPSEVVICRVADTDEVEATWRAGPDWETISASPRGDWQPDLSVAPGGDVWVVWDTCDGADFHVVARRFDGNEWDALTAVAASDAFEARARVAHDSRGRTWVAWEEGARGWGHPYRGNALLWNNSTDASGPLHRLRRVHLATLDERGRVRHLAKPLPMPSFDRARRMPNRREGGEGLGVFYERPELVIDDRDRPWVVYRHFFERQLGCTDAVKHHVEEGWRVDARCLDGPDWSPLYAFDVLQRDGTQRLSLAAAPDGLLAIWTTGRTDRRKDPLPRGVAVGRIVHESGRASPRLRAPVKVVMPEVRPRAAERPTAEVAGETFTLVFGDLHRHTDLSLCFPFFDGSLDDAYRYAMEVAQLDFLGITDHTRDIDRGAVQSQLWWRSIKNVTRHHAPGHFIPFFAFERSHRDTDHNVISLRDDMLANYPPPLPEFWATITDADTITIPHSTPNAKGTPFNGRIWDYQDDARRPLLEVYQGFRDTSSLAEAQVPLAKGYHIGLIASSDHLSTSASYACVWTDEVEREAVFRSLQARRTFGATAPMRLVFRAGAHWMGEIVSVEGPLEVTIEVDADAPLEEVELWIDGQVVERFTPDGRQVSLSATTVLPLPAPGQESYAFVRVVRADGQRAWSSPIWFHSTP